MDVESERRQACHLQAKVIGERIERMLCHALDQPDMRELVETTRQIGQCLTSLADHYESRLATTAPTFEHFLNWLRQYGDK